MSDGSSPTGQVVQKVIQDKLAWWVFFVSCGGILLAAYLGYSGSSGHSRREIFTTLVPLFSTWVGTILAFYFSRENFESARNAVDRAIEKLTPDEKLQKTSVSQVMKLRNAMKGLPISASRTEKDIKVSELRALAEQGFSRVIIFGENDSVKYVIPESALNKFIADNALALTPVDINTVTLETMLATKFGNEQLKALASRFAVIRADANLKDARDAMVAVPDAKDVFVTKSGKKDEPVVGWLTNTDITKDL